MREDQMALSAGRQPDHDDIDGVAPPQINDFITGHTDIREFLGQAYQEGRMHHALLFEGPQGIGKATTAFHLAGHILSNSNAETASLQLATPDYSRSPYRQIAQDIHPALMHITRPLDPKTGKYRTGITVEEIRRITHFLSRTSHDGSWRIVIIDPADDMNRNAANALLKTLEEPPARALFILISHSSGKLLPTIRSRCQSLTFKALPDADLQQALTVVGRGIGIDTENQQQFTALTARAEGSVRKAILMLAYGGLDITDTVDAIIREQPFNVHKAQTLANVLGGRDAEIQNDLFTDYILEIVADQALNYAAKGAVAQAGYWSQFWSKLQSELNDTASYNLDRKQGAMIMLSRLHTGLLTGMPV